MTVRAVVTVIDRQSISSASTVIRIITQLLNPKVSVSLDHSQILIGLWQKSGRISGADSRDVGGPNFDRQRPRH